jgi:hypothetical protein
VIFHGVEEKLAGSFNTSNLGFSPSAKSQDLFYSVCLDIPERRGKKKTPHSVTKQRPGEGKKQPESDGHFSDEGHVGSANPSKSSRPTSYSEGSRSRGVEGVAGIKKSRNRGIEGSRDRGIEESWDRGIEASDGIGAVEELKTSNGIPKARTWRRMKVVKVGPEVWW